MSMSPSTETVHLVCPSANKGCNKVDLGSGAQGASAAPFVLIAENLTQCVGFVWQGLSTGATRVARIC